MPTRSIRLLWPALIACCALACGSQPASHGPSSEPELAPEQPPAATPVAQRAAPAEGTPRVRYDLARHVARAELFHGDARVIDLGAASGHQHTLGGWRTRTGDTHDFADGTSATVVRDVTGFFVVPLEASRCTVSMRARGFGARQATLYLDDQTFGFVELPADGSFAVVRASIPADRCTPGEHELRVRVPTTGSAPGLPRAGIAVDWLRVGASDDPHADVGPPSPSSLTRPESDQPALRIPDGWTMAYAFEVPAGARVRGIVRGSGRVHATLERDGAPPESLGVLTATASGASFDLDLAAHAPHVVRLAFRAEGEPTLVRPAVVTLDGVTPRSIPRLRNVVVYLTDTLRADRLRPYSPDTRVQTPGLSSWAERAATFLGAHSQENWTKPSVATLLSGLFPWEHHATTEAAEVPASVELLSERLSDRGFHTGAFVANGFVSDRFGFRQGWGLFRNYVREGRRNLARFVAADVIEWLDQRPTDRPFFLYVHTIDPHVPYIPPSEDIALYDPEPYEGVVDFHRDRTLLERIKAGGVRLNDRDRQRLGALYDGEITYHDRHFASVIEALERRGLADDTLVVFTADHGEELFDHGSVGHGHSVFEEIIRVPLIVRWPGLTDGAVRIDDAVGLVDVMPTILEALGQEVPSSMSGRSIAPLLAGRSEDAPRPSVTAFLEGWRTVVVGRYKLVQRTTSHWMLYDLAADPQEQHDLAAERPLTVRYLRGLLGLALAQAERPTRPATEHRAAQTVIDEQLRQQLEALGYAGASRAPTDDGIGE